MNITENYRYCKVTCGHNFYTRLFKRVGEIGNCDQCKDYPMVGIIEVVECEHTKDQ